MKLLLEGPPASGKGTQGEMISGDYGIPLISVGQSLRDLPPDHPRYTEIQTTMEVGDLVPDDVVSELIKERLEHDDCKNGYILDGYGRRLHQIELFEPPADAVILIDIPEEETFKRISGRRMCTADGEVYNIYTLPKEEIEKCEGDLIQRDDDKEDAVKVRLQKYNDETQDMLEYYDNKGLLVKIDGMGTPDEVYGRIKEQLDKIK